VGGRGRARAARCRAQSPARAGIHARSGGRPASVDSPTIAIASPAATGVCARSRLSVRSASRG
jgi:hypothetical protein